MFGFVELDRFYSSTQVARQNLPLATPVVVTAEKLVLCVNSAAELGGLRVGMGRSEARSLLPEATFFAYKAEDYDEARGAWLDLLLEVSARIESLTPASATLDLVGHPDPADVMEQFLRRLRRELGWRVRVGVAKQPWLARAKAREFNLQAHALGLFPVEPVLDSEAYASQLPVQALPVGEDIRKRLEFLGYTRVGSLSQTPLAALRAQFGKEAERIRTLAAGGPDRRLQPNYPTEAIHAEIALAGGSEDRQVLDAALDRLARRISDRLVTRDAEGRHLRLWLELESGEVLAWDRVFSRAMRHAASLKLAFSLLLENQQIEEPVVRVRAMLPQLERGRQGQESFAEMMGHEERTHRAEKALRHVRAVFGDQAVLPASRVEVPRRVRLMRTWRNVLGWR